MDCVNFSAQGRISLMRYRLDGQAHYYNNFQHLYIMFQHIILSIFILIKAGSPAARDHAPLPLLPHVFCYIKFLFLIILLSLVTVIVIIYICLYIRMYVRTYMLRPN